jgi:uncharacterized protein with HEPN domain
MSIDRDPGYVLDILDAARTIGDYIAGMDWAAFETDKLRRDGVMMRILVIGEATKRLSDDFRQRHPDIPWQQMAGMRDFLIHDYDKVIVLRIWETATQAIPALIVQLESIIPPETKSDEE